MGEGKWRMIMEHFSLKKSDVLIIDYKVGNHLSITHALDFLGYRFTISNRKEDIEQANCFILPGVGTFGEAMANLGDLGIIPLLREQVLVQRKPILGICLGMQILAESSEEKGMHLGLGWIPGRVKRIEGHGSLRVPHVGWNDVKILKRDPFFSRTGENPYFYFDHSYHFATEPQWVAAKVVYGQELTAAVQRENIFGVQFHPEKSQNNGLKLLRGFFNDVVKFFPSFTGEGRGC